MISHQAVLTRHSNILYPKSLNKIKSFRRASLGLHGTSASRLVSNAGDRLVSHRLSVSFRAEGEECLCLRRDCSPRSRSVHNDTSTLTASICIGCRGRFLTCPRKGLHSTDADRQKATFSVGGPSTIAGVRWIASNDPCTGVSESLSFQRRLARDKSLPNTGFDVKLDIGGEGDFAAYVEDNNSSRVLTVVRWI